MSKKNEYSSWPLGLLPKEWQRTELEQLRDSGYDWDDPRDAIELFEQKIADYAGCKYAVTVDCCSNGLFLCLKCLKATGTVTIPKKTYISVPMQIIHAGCDVEFEELEWSGLYQLKPLPVYDSAVRWTKNMFVGGNDALQVASFQLKKRLPIGRGGVIMTNNEAVYKWLKKSFL